MNITITNMPLQTMIRITQELASAKIWDCSYRVVHSPEEGLTERLVVLIERLLLVYFFPFKF